MGRGAGRWLAVECGVAVVVIVGVLPSTRREPISPRSVTSSINRALVVGRDTLNTTRAVEIVAFTMPMRKGLGVRTQSELAPWLMIAIGFVFFAAISAVAGFALIRLASPERSAQLEEHAASCSVCLGRSFAFLVGFAITITWSAVGAGQDAVDLQASSAQQLSLGRG